VLFDTRVRTTLLILLALFFPRQALSDDQLRHKIAQMIIVGFNGTTVPDSLRTDLTGRNLGGVVLLGRNCVSPAQIQQLNVQIRSLAQTPPFIAVDQEGGTVARLNQSNGFAPTFSAYWSGTVLNSADSTASQAATMAGWLNSSGFSANFAPVLDVNVNPQSPAIGHYGRSFSGNPSTVALHAERYIDQFHARRIITTLKHFPGHGSAGTDSHLELPDITSTWADSELIPYRSLLAVNKVDMVMVGHLYNARIDSIYPSSLSFNTITGLLRESLGYKGVVITDDLFAMRAITDRYGYGEAAVRAINAGVDVLLYVGNMLNGSSLVRQLTDTIEANVRNGIIAESRINESYARIQQLKGRFLGDGVQGTPLASASVPALIRLENYPNPFNPATTLRVTFDRPTRATISLTNLLGQELARLEDRHFTAGTFEFIWDAKDRPTGVYFCTVRTESGVATRRLLLLR
jgi:beta-N-acetylhexosaminidase